MEGAQVGFQTLESYGIDLRTEVLLAAVKAAANQTSPTIVGPKDKRYTPTEAALAVVEAYREAVKALDAEAGQASD